MMKKHCFTWMQITQKLYQNIFLKSYKLIVELFAQNYSVCSKLYNLHSRISDYIYLYNIMKVFTKIIIPLLVVALAIVYYNRMNKSPVETKVMLIMGGPGSGKGTQSQYLAKEFGFVHLSVGQILRERAKSGGVIGEQILNSMKKGELVSNYLVSRMLDEEFDRKGRQLIYLLDGFPRSIQNFLAYEQHTNNILNLIGLIYLECSDAIMENRLVQRAKKVQRPDNDIYTIRNRIHLFNEHTRIMIDKFQNDTLIVTVPGDGTIEEVFQNLREKMIQVGFKPAIQKSKL